MTETFNRLGKILAVPILTGMVLVSGCVNSYYDVYSNHAVELLEVNNHTLNILDDCNIYVYSNEKKNQFMSAEVDCKTGNPTKIHPNSKVSDLEKFANPQEIKNIFQKIKAGEK